MSAPFAITPVLRTQWKWVAGFYLTVTLVYYLATWYAYGGLGGGHPPLLDPEEFFASAGLKFSVFFLVSGLLWALTDRVRPTGTTRYLAGQAVALVCFVLLAHGLQRPVLTACGWVYFFGGRLAIFNHLLAGGFFVLQTCLLLLLYYRGRGTQVRGDVRAAAGPEVPELLLVSKGNYSRPLRTAAIGHLTAAGNYTEVAAAGETYLLNCGIGAAERRLPALPFLRIHRSHLVNLDRVRRIRRDGRRQVVELEDGTVLPVGDKYRGALRHLGVSPARAESDR